MLKIPTPQSPVKEITTMHLKLSQKIPILGWGFRFLFKNRLSVEELYIDVRFTTFQAYWIELQANWKA